ncbi:MAG: polymer-forming cytoskeletal protein [Enterobacteriaceae bacterium]|nr:polymer-forming cytoskeletal protein [Enterobacteriaceae bacterium]
MFGKKSSNTSVNAIPAVAKEAMNEVKSSADNSELRQQRCTVIAKNSSFNGDIEDSGDIQIYGKVIGNIHIKEGAIRVMSSGYVQGELNAPEVVIDGHVQGSCFAENIDILEHGTLRGHTCCCNFSIKRGGTFVGQSAEWTPKETLVLKDEPCPPVEQLSEHAESQLYIFQDVKGESQPQSK